MHGSSQICGPWLSRVTRNAAFEALKKTRVPFHFVALSLLLLASCKKEAPEVIVPPVTEKLIIPANSAYTGAYIDIGENEDEVTLDTIDDFEKLAGKHQAIIASSSYWGEQNFPTDSVSLIQQHGSIPLVYWSPWDTPYEEGGGPDRFSLTDILAGKWDDYIDAWAVSAKQFAHPFFVSLANEPNGSGFPWSGCYYGAGKIIPNTNPVQYEGPETYKKAYRYVVDRVRAKGASNIIWVFQVINYSDPQDDWNYANQYYPGASYVDWIGLSVYGQQYADDKWSAFTPLLQEPYAEVCRLDPHKPIMLAEWGCGEFPKSGSKSQFIAEAFDDMKKNYTRLKAAVFWNESWQNEDDTTSDLRINSSPEALDAYRKGVADPFWMDKPVYTKLGR